MARLFDRVARITVGANASNDIEGITVIGAMKGIRVEQHRATFKIEKTIKQQPNTCELKIWNLSKKQRGAIEEIRPKKGDKRGIPVLIEAGYAETGPQQIFIGDLRASYSEKSGPDWVTTVESGDGEKATATARINVAFGPKTAADTVLRAIVKTLGLGPGNLSSAISKLRTKGLTQLYTHGVTLTGSASIQLTNFCKSADLDWSVQDGALQFVDRGKALSSKAILLNSRTGLIESPTADNKGVVTAKMLLTSDVRPGRLIVVDSVTVQGTYLVQKASWEGDTFGGPWYVTVEGTRY